jgi:hypothetical protein
MLTMSGFPASTYSTIRSITAGFVVHICGPRRLPSTSANQSGCLSNDSVVRKLKASNQLCPNTADLAQAKRARRDHFRAASRNAGVW